MECTVYTSEQFGDYFALLFCLHHPEIMTEKLVMPGKPQFAFFSGITHILAITSKCC